MRISKKKRVYLADTAAKIAEYIVSLVILGQIITGRINIWVLIVAGITFVVFVIVGAILTPDD